MEKASDPRENLVVIFALFGGDAEVTRRILASVGIASEICGSVDALVGSLAQGAGALVLAEEALVPDAVRRLESFLRAQEAWSDLPIVVSATESGGGREGFGVLGALGAVGNVSIVERPVRVRAMIGAVQSALRARGRQYAARGLLRAVAASEARFRGVQERAPYGLSLLQPVRNAADIITDFRWVYANAVTGKALGRAPDSLVGLLLSDVLPGLKADGYISAYVEAFQTGVPNTRESFYRSDGFDNAFRRTAFQLEGDLALVFEDVTERKRAEVERARLLDREQAARTEAEAVSRSKDEFLATISHELRTPLNAMLGWARMLVSGRLEEAKHERALQAIERNAVAQAQLVDDLLDVSRIISGKLRLDLDNVDLRRVVEAAVDSVRPALDAKGIRFYPALDPAASSVRGDPNRLQQVIWNLLSNAIKFTPKGGRVQLTLARVNSHIEITIADDGQGFDSAFLPFLFQRFQQQDGSSTRRHGGLGLGLAICRHLVELHGGTIDASSDGPGRGAIFRVQLPLLAIRPPDAEVERVHPTSDRNVTFEVANELRGITVLLVDDMPDARELLVSVVEECGARAVEASSAEEALALVVSERPDVVVSDIGMPGKDGYWLIRQIRALSVEDGGRTPSAALTAYARAEDRLNALKSGFEMHIAKPVEPAEFVTVLATLARIGRAMQ